MTESSRIFVAPDVRTAEELLLSEIERLRPAAAPMPGVAAVRVVVPSTSLREHLQAKLARRRAAWLGIEVSTLAATARSILVAAGELAPVGGALFPLEVERAARREPVLAAAFAELTDGWGPLHAAARDLVDAGFQPALAEALGERIDAERGALPRPTLERARALVAAVSRALDAMERSGLAPPGALFARAAVALAAAPAAPVEGFLYGFSDATGLASDLLAALVRAGARAILVDPWAAGPAAPEFGRRLRERLESAGGRGRLLAPPGAGAGLRLLVESSPESEARALARAIGDAIDGGVEPEGIGLVLREPAAHRSELRRALERRAVPFSAAATHGPASPLAYRARSLLRCLERRAETPVDAALELLDGAPELSAEHRAAVRLALRALGVASLGNAGELDPASFERFRSEGLRLPARAGLIADEEDRETAPHRRLPVEPLLGSLERLRDLSGKLVAWPVRGPWTDHLQALAEILAVTALDSEPAGAELLERAAALEGQIPPELELSAAEAATLLAGAWSEGARASWGGRGSGVQLLSVTEARGRSFERLYLAGLVRGEFPRVVAEDPVLPDVLRLRLRELLPDLPVKREGHDEERFLFEQLLGAAPAVVLSRARSDEEGRETPPSTLLEGLLRRTPVEPLEVRSRAPEPALERGIAAALAGREAGLAPHLSAVLEEGRRRFSPESLADPSAAAAARERILLEFDTDPIHDEGRRRIRRLGPYFGFLGAQPAERRVAATTLERQADCAWRAFLERGLRLERSPDPLEALPTLDALLVGSVVHEALAALFEDPPGAPEPSVEARLAGPERPLSWPGEDEVERVARGVSREALREAGLGGKGLEAPLAARVLERLRVARAEDERLEGATLLGVELEGELRLGADRADATAITYRTDRLQREAGRPVLVDFKVGRVPAGLDARTESTRRRHLLAGVRRGQRLQAAIYALSVETPRAEGRYLYLDPGDEAPLRAVGLGADEELRSALGSAAALLIESRRRGLHPPRLLDPKLEREYGRCEDCPMLEACVQRDSGFRLRLERWHELERGREGRRSGREESLWRLWRLPVEPEEDA